MKSIFKHFTIEELQCHCGKCGLGQFNMDVHGMNKVVDMRVELGAMYPDYRMPVTSAIRCEAHNAEVGGAKHSVHVTGKALDVSISGENLTRLMNYLHTEKGEFIGGLGLDQHGANHIIHIDWREKYVNSYRRYWTY